jgi:hypothetical protein
MSSVSLARGRAKCHFSVTPNERFRRDMKREIAMKDEMFGRMWVAHHDELSLSIDRGLSRLRGRLAGVRKGLEKLAAWDGTTSHLAAMVAAFLITSFGLISTTATPV